MTVKSQIVFYGWVGREPRETMQALAKSGFVCVFQGVDPKVKEKFALRIGGSSTATAAVVDLGENSIESAESILAACPGLKNKILVLGQNEKKPVDGLVFTTSAGLLDLLRKHA